MSDAILSNLRQIAGDAHVMTGDDAVPWSRDWSDMVHWTPLAVVRPADTGLAATVKVVEPLGAHLLVTCSVDGALFRAVLDSDLTVRRGDTLTLAPQPDRVRWFDPETTLAVA